MKTGMIGLGTMGTNIALNLHKAGHLHRVWNRSRPKADDLASKTGVDISPDIGDLAAKCDLIITCVSTDFDVLEVMNQIAVTACPETIIVDTSTVSSLTAEKAASLVQQRGAGFLDCPVTGGVEGAKNGTLSIMVGGDKSLMEKVKPILSSIGSKIVHIGPTGSGQACKAVNQILCAGINQAVTEGLAFGEAMGLDMDRVVQAISSGAAGNWFLDHRGQSMLAGSYKVGFKVSLHHKDLMICMAMAEQNLHSSLPLTAMTIADYEVLMEQGYDNEDISALYRLKRK